MREAAAVEVVDGPTAPEDEKAYAATARSRGCEWECWSKFRSSTASPPLLLALTLKSKLILGDERKMERTGWICERWRYCMRMAGDTALS